MLLTVFIAFFIISLACAVLGFILKEQAFSILGLAGLGFIILGLFSITDGIEFRTGSNISISGTTENFIFTEYPTTNYALGLITLGLGLVSLIASWKTIIGKKKKEYYEVEDDY